jgi:hypothetical protein
MNIRWHCGVGTCYQLPFRVMSVEQDKQRSKINRWVHLFCIFAPAALLVLLRCFPSHLVLSCPQRYSLPMLNSSRRQRTWSPRQAMPEFPCAINKCLLVSVSWTLTSKATRAMRMSRKLIFRRELVLNS